NYYELASLTTDRFNNTILAGFFNGTLSLGNLTINSNVISQYNHSLFIAKIDSNDNVRWMIPITEIQSTNFPRTKIVCDNKKNILLAIDISDSVVLMGHKIYCKGGSDGVLVKIDSNGQYLFHLKIDGQYEEGIGCDEIGILPNNDFVISGGFGNNVNIKSQSSFSGKSLSVEGIDGYIAKYNESGVLNWVSRCGSKNNTDGYWGTKISNSSDLYSVVSLTPSFNIYFDSTYHYTFPQSGYSADAIVKYDSNGIFKWVKGIYTPNFPDIISIQDFEVLKNETVLAFGSYKSVNSVLVEGYGSFPPNQSGSGTNDALCFLICYDSLGNVLWAKNPHKLIGSTEQPVGLIASKINSDFYFVSYFDGSAIISGTDTVYGTGYQNVLIECMDSMGNKKWHKIIKGFPGTNARDITINDKNEIIIVGNTSSSTLQCDAKKVNIGSTPAMYILKLAPGDVNWNDTLNGFEDVTENKEQLVVYPNPAEQSIVIRHQSLVNTIVVTDVMGRNCIIPPLQGGKGDVSIDVSSLYNGIYFIKATASNGSQLNGKFVKQ
ncbi:MAG: hypothetical protein RIQ33_1322, partial [Bacteroidota bacterium]